MSSSTIPAPAPEPADPHPATGPVNGEPRRLNPLAALMTPIEPAHPLDLPDTATTDGILTATGQAEDVPASGGHSNHFHIDTPDAKTDKDGSGLGNAKNGRQALMFALAHRLQQRGITKGKAQDVAKMQATADKERAAADRERAKAKQEQAKGLQTKVSETVSRKEGGSSPSGSGGSGSGSGSGAGAKGKTGPNSSTGNRQSPGRGSGGSTGSGNKGGGAGAGGGVKKDAGGGDRKPGNGGGRPGGDSAGGRGNGGVTPKNKNSGPSPAKPDKNPGGAGKGGLHKPGGNNGAGAGGGGSAKPKPVKNSPGNTNTPPQNKNAGGKTTPAGGGGTGGGGKTTPPSQKPGSGAGDKGVKTPRPWHRTPAPQQNPKPPAPQQSPKPSAPTPPPKPNLQKTPAPRTPQQKPPGPQNGTSPGGSPGGKPQQPPTPTSPTSPTSGKTKTPRPWHRTPAPKNKPAPNTPPAPGGQPTQPGTTTQPVILTKQPTTPKTPTGGTNTNTAKPPTKKPPNGGSNSKATTGPAKPAPTPNNTQKTPVNQSKTVKRPNPVSLKKPPTPPKPAVPPKPANSPRRTQKARETGYRHGTAVGNGVAQAQAYRDGIKDGIRGPLDQGRREAAAMDAIHAQRAKDRQEKPVPILPTSAAHHQAAAVPPQAQPIPAAHINGKIHLGPGADRKTISRGEVNNLRDYQGRLGEKATDLQHDTEATVQLKSQAEDLATRAQHLLETARSLELGPASVAAASTANENVTQVSSLVEALHHKLARGSDQAMALNTHTHIRYDQIYRAVEDSVEKAPANDMRYYTQGV